MKQFFDENGVPLEAHPFDDTAAFQNSFTLEQKGWQVQVEWGETQYGIGCVAGEDIPEGTIVRYGRVGQNLSTLDSYEKIQRFIAGRGDDGEEGKRMRQWYIQHYLFGVRLPTGLEEGGGEVWTGVYMPGMAINHSEDPTVRHRPKLDDEGNFVGIDVVAVKDMKKGDVVCNDYRLFPNPPPPYAIRFKEEYGVESMVFPTMNDFV